MGHAPGEEDDNPFENLGSESDAEEESLFTNDAERLIAQDQERNIRHDPIKVKRSQNPFADEQGLHDLQVLLATARVEKIFPDGYGVREQEWDDYNYPETEIIKYGKKRRDLEVILPSEMWLPRAILWAQALDIMVRLVEARNL